MGRLCRRCGGRIGLYFQRYFLVLGCRGRGLRHVVIFHGAGVLGHPQVGGAERRPAVAAVADTHQPAGRCGHRRASAEPSDGTCHFLRGVFQEMAENNMEGFPADGSAERSDAGRYPVGYHPGNRQCGFSGRRLLRQYVGSAVQQRHHRLLHSVGSRSGVGIVVYTQERQTGVECRRAEFCHAGDRILDLLCVGDPSQH